MISFFTNSGRAIDLGNLHPDDIDIDEIANALSNSCRYNGQTSRFYSVAEHSVLLCEYALDNGYSEGVQAVLLMHDASEAFCGDIVYHLKAKLPEFIALENKILKVIFDRYGLDDHHNDLIKKLDRAICIDEMYQLMGGIDPQLFIQNPNIRPLNVLCEGLTPDEAKAKFLYHAKRLLISGAE